MRGYFNLIVMFLSSLTMIALFLNEGGPNLTEGFLENPKGSLGETK